MIIGFSGKKQSGKDTAVSDLQRRLRPYDRRTQVIRFADELKRIVQTCFGVPQEVFDSEAGKMRMLDCGMTLRTLLQHLGTDVFRRIDPQCWVRTYCQAVHDEYEASLALDEILPVILTPDVRFANEVAAVHKLGGVVIRLMRSPHTDTHLSEVSLADDFAGFDVVVDNRDMSIEQQNEAVWTLVSKRGWL
jgi:hypothetical protein